MSGFIWHWIKGNRKFFTKKMEVVKKAMNEGCLVTCLKTPSRNISHNKKIKRGNVANGYSDR